MNLYTIYDKSGIHSGRALGTHLIRELASKATVQRGRPARLELLQRRGQRYDYIVNVGWFREFNAGGAVVLNTPKAISASSNKRSARILFKDKGIPAPELWLSAGSIPTEAYPVIARTTHHTKGKGLWLCNNSSEAARAVRLGATHFLKYIKNTREFRVHIMAPKPDLSGMTWEDFLVMKLSEKIPNENAEPDPVVKSHDNGWVFSYPADRRSPILPIIRDTARQAIALFGLHWGAVDIMVSKDTGSVYVLEINSTPCLTDDHANTLQKYASGIRSLVGLSPALSRKKAKAAAPITSRRDKLRRNTVLHNALGRYL